MGKAVASILGGGSTPKVDKAPIVETEEEKRKAKNSRSALYETEGGVAGAELNMGQVKKRDTLLGN